MDTTGAPLPPRRPRTLIDGITSLPVVGRIAGTFVGEPTTDQTVFDVLFGVAAPVVLVGLDRIWDPTSEGGVLPFRPHSVIAVTASVLVLVAWLRLRRRAGWWHAMTAGGLGFGACVAAGIGLALLPYTIIGLVIGVGVLGVAPFLAAFVFVRAAARALGSSLDRLPPLAAVTLAALVGCVLFVGCYGAGRVTKGVERIAVDVITGKRRGSPERAEFALHVMYVYPGVTLWPLRKAVSEADDPLERARLEDLHVRISGHSADRS